MKKNLREQRKETGKMLKKTVTYIIDAIIVIAILMVGLYGYKIISNKYLNKDSAQYEMALITVEFQKHDPEVLRKIEVGQTVSDGKKHEVIGTVKTVGEIKNSTEIIKDYNKNSYVKAETDAFSELTVVLECPAVVTDESVRLGNTDVKIGTELEMKTPQYNIKGSIMGIDFESK